MVKVNWSKIVQFILTVLTAAATAFGVSSCRLDHNGNDNNNDRPTAPVSRPLGK